MGDDTGATLVTSADDHADVSGLELDDLSDPVLVEVELFMQSQIRISLGLTRANRASTTHGQRDMSEITHLDGVVNLDKGVRVTDGATVVGDDVRNTAGSELDLADLAELVGSLLRRDAVDGEAALDVVKDTEVLARLLNGDSVHEAKGEGVVGADLRPTGTSVWERVKP